MRLYRAKFNVGSLQVWQSDNSFTVSAYPISNAMRWRRETTHTAPRFFSRLPRTPSTLFPLPLTVQHKRRGGRRLSLLLRWTVRGKGDGWGGCGRGGKKLLGPYVVLPAPPALHFVFAFEASTQMSFNIRIPALGRRAAQNSTSNTRPYPKHRPHFPPQQPIGRQQRDRQQHHRPHAQRACDINPIAQPL
jgi:hypothetical protein